MITSLSVFTFLSAIPKQKPYITLPVQRLQTLRYIWLDCPTILQCITKIQSNRVTEVCKVKKPNVSSYHSVQESHHPRWLSFPSPTVIICCLKRWIHGEIRASWAICYCLRKCLLAFSRKTFQYHPGTHQLQKCLQKVPFPFPPRTALPSHSSRFLSSSEFSLLFSSSDPVMPL